MTFRTLLPVGVAIAASCALLQPRFESVDPEYGYVDGCTDITLQGAEIGVDAEVSIGGEALLSLEPAQYDDAFPEHAQDVGFKYFGVTPPAPDMASGFYDVVMTVPTDGEPLVRTLHKGFYYVACPAEVYAADVVLAPGEGDSADTAAPPPAPIAPGDVVPVIGCGLDPNTVVAELRDATGAVIRTMPLVSDCLTARVHFAIQPDTEDGEYFLVFVSDSGYIDGHSCEGGGPPDSADTAGHTGDTAATCTYTRPITVAGGVP